MSLRYLIGDVFDRLAELPDNSVHLAVTSPPFLALRSYLPDDHPDKHREIGSEAGPAEFIDTLLAVTAELRRIVVPWGSICIELGDTYAGSGGAGGDYNAGGLRDGQAKFIGSSRRSGGYPLAKSMCIIPHLYTASLAYGRNILTGQPSPAGQWRIRNVICWARPNPPVGALGDKFRPATSYITVACVGPKRYFDLDSVRTTPTVDPATYTGNGYTKGNPAGNGTSTAMAGNPAGAPPLDWHTDNQPEDGDWLWKLPTSPYPGAHFATFGLHLPLRLIRAMCPMNVCQLCGLATGADGYTYGDIKDCDHDWTPGVVLDPFAGSGTTLEAAQAVGRHAIGIDLDPRNANLARDRVGMFLEVTP